MLLGTFLFLALSFGAYAKQMNVLFLASDDMRPQLGAYEGASFPVPVSPKMYTPNLDALAKKSLLLKQAYVQVAVCNPSRTSLLTSRRADTTHVYDLVHYWRKIGGNYTTVPQYFKEHGYNTLGMGKIFHPGKVASGGDDPISWSGKYYHAPDKYWSQQVPKLTWRAINETLLKDHPLVDQQTAAHAIKTLKELAPAAKNKEQPFFLAVGFHKPHLPFNIPESFFKYYPKDDIKLPKNPYAPVDMPQVAWSWFDELRTYSDINTKYGYGAINTTLPDEIVKDLRRAYYAAISYTDDLIGQVLRELDNLGLSDNTIVSFWGDHGWQLGEHGEWCKHTNFELSTHAPMMVRVPGITDHGPVTSQLTEFVDLFPSLVEAAGLPKLSICPVDSTKVETCTEGTSFVPLMSQPERGWKKAAFSQYRRMAVDGNIIMGYSIRTSKYRYTEWVYHTDYPDYKPNWEKIFHKESEELYDHSTDPDENINKAHMKEFNSVKMDLRKQLHAGWRHAQPV